MSVHSASSLALSWVFEHLADHRHARRPLRHAAEVGVAELGHPAAAPPQSREHDLHRRGRDRMLLRHPVDQIAVVC
jgi:hypothetical protein